MKKVHVYLSVFFFAVLAWSCTREDDTLGESGIYAPVGGTIEIDKSAHAAGEAEGMTETGEDENDLLENAAFSKTITITFGETVQVENAYAEAGVSLSINGQDVVVNTTLDGVEYVLTGTSTDGSFKVYSDHQFKLSLTDLSLTNADGPAINSQSAERAFVVLTGTNQLTDGATYAAAPDLEDQKGAFFSEGQLIFSGTGELTVQGNHNHAIASDRYIRVRSGVITVNGAVANAIHCTDYFIADGGTFAIQAQHNGIEADTGYIIINHGEFALNVAGNGITTSYQRDSLEDAAPEIDPYLIVNNGIFTINCTEGSAMASQSTLTINDADMTLNSTDDCIHATAAIYINKGVLHCVSAGSDALGSDGTITLTGGTLIALGAEEGIDCGSNELKITGGFVLGGGNATSIPTESASSLYTFIGGSMAADEIIHVEDANGKEIFTFMNPASFNSLLVATPKLKANTTYTVYTGGTVTNNVGDLHGLYTQGKYSRGTAVAQFTTTNKVTQIGKQG